MYSSTLPSSSALDGLGGQRHASAALPPGKTCYPFYRRLGEPQGRSGQVLKISPQPGFDPRTVQPVASRYTDWTIPAPNNGEEGGEMFRVSLFLVNRWLRCLYSASLKIQGFQFSLSLQHTNNRLENTSVFYLLLFKSLTKMSVLG